MAIWLGAALIIISGAAIALGIAIIFLMTFFQASQGGIDEAWLREVISTHLLATIGSFIIIALGTLLLCAGLFSKYRARHKIAAAGGNVQLN